MTIPNGFCIIPFTQYSTYNTYEYRLCCMAEEPEIPIDQKSQSINDIWNSNYLKDVRKTMINGKWHKDCNKCKKLEEAGIVSSRQYENELHEDILESTKLFSKESSYEARSPINFDFRLGNLCNLQCQMCASHASHLVSVERAAMINNNLIDLNDPSIADLYENEWIETSNTKKEALINNDIDWDSFLPLLPTVRNIKLIGGEPTVNPNMARLFQECIDADVAKNITLQFYTNVTNVNDNWLDELGKFKKVIVSCSLEGSHGMNDYLRHPSDWNTIWDNFKSLTSYAHSLPKNKIRVRVTTVNQITNSLHLADFYRLLYDYTRETGYEIGLSSNQLTSPEYYSMRHAPRWLVEDQTKLIQSLWEDIEKNANQIIKEDFEDALKDIMLFSANAEYNFEQMKRFVLITDAYDKHREVSILDVFPEYARIKEELQLD